MEAYPAMNPLITHFGTATSTVCRYSESLMKCSWRTTSTRDRTDRFPLRRWLDSAVGSRSEIHTSSSVATGPRHPWRDCSCSISTSSHCRWMSFPMTQSSVRLNIGKDSTWGRTLFRTSIISRNDRCTPYRPSFHDHPLRRYASTGCSFTRIC